MTSVKSPSPSIVVTRRDSDGKRWLRCIDHWDYDPASTSFAIKKSSCQLEP